MRSHDLNHLLDEPGPDAAEHSFQIGYKVSEVAQGLFPAGIPIGDDDLNSALTATKAAMASHPDRPIFEAPF